MEEYVKYATYAVEMVSKEMNVHNSFLFYLEFLVGLSEGCVPSKVPLLFEYILPTLKGLVPLLKMLVGHSEAILLILQVFSCTADRLLPHLPEVRRLESNTCPTKSSVQIPSPGWFEDVIQAQLGGSGDVHPPQCCQVQRRVCG